eukprot:scaffold11620_cov19-Tisochrysis_lutea.AAC.4
MISRQAHARPHPLRPPTPKHTHALLCLQAVYGVLKEAEHRSTFYIPYWNIPITKYIVPRQAWSMVVRGMRSEWCWLVKRSREGADRAGMFSAQ